jgi:hypothetical protein
MNQTKRFLFLTCLAFVLFTSCNKDCIKPTGIEGEWIWTKSIGGIGGWTLTPESEGMTKKLIIDPRYYREFVNDTLLFQVQYDLVTRNSVMYIDFENGISYIIEVESRNLSLTEYLWSDGYTHAYLRK